MIFISVLRQLSMLKELSDAEKDRMDASASQLKEVMDKAFADLEAEGK